MSIINSLKNAGSTIRRDVQKAEGTVQSTAKKVAGDVRVGAAYAKTELQNVEAAAITAYGDITRITKTKNVFKAGPLLAGADCTSSGGAPTMLRFNASAPGADFGTAGHESTAVSIFVDGKYQSTQTILAERQDSSGFGGYQVNLGTLPAGPHQVEIRSASWLAGAAAQPAVVQKPKLEELSGIQAQVSQYAPLLVTRRPRAYVEGPKLDGRATMTHTDAPLALRAEVLGDPAGYHQITYKVTLSDEDSGTADPKRNQVYGRTTDDEWVYRVLVDGNGDRVTPQQLAALKGSNDPAWKSFLDAAGAVNHTDAAATEAALTSPETYQYGNDKLLGATRHQPRDFNGAHQGDRPLIRVNSGNNNFAAVKATSKLDTPVWSPNVVYDTASVRRDAAGHVIQTGHLTDKQIIARLPWIGTVTAKEVLREDGKPA